jgi:hypothetical protein
VEQRGEGVEVEIKLKFFFQEIETTKHRLAGNTTVVL